MVDFQRKSTAFANPLDFVITGGEVADCTQISELTRNLKSDAILADKDYDSDGVVKSIENTGTKAAIPPRKNRIIQREYDKHLYKKNGIKLNVCLDF